MIREAQRAGASSLRAIADVLNARGPVGAGGSICVMLSRLIGFSDQGHYGPPQIVVRVQSTDHRGFWRQTDRPRLGCRGSRPHFPLSLRLPYHSPSHTSWCPLDQGAAR